MLRARRNHTTPRRAQRKLEPQTYTTHRGGLTAVKPRLRSPGPALRLGTTSNARNTAARGPPITTRAIHPQAVAVISFRLPIPGQTRIVQSSASTLHAMTADRPPINPEEIPERLGAQLRVPHGVANVAMAKVVLNRSSVVTIGGQLVWPSFLTK
jgi:hypothetical protein